MDVANLDAPALRRQLVDCTISAGNNCTNGQKSQVFAEYVTRAQPGLQLAGLEVNETAAALNSISALADLTTDSGNQRVFLKIHIEAGQISGGGDEYQNGRMLAEAGWPVIRPIAESDNEEYPLLVYEAFKPDEQVLFDSIQASYVGDTSDLESLLPAVADLHRTAGRAQVARVRVEDSLALSRTAPLHIFFGRRLDPGARADQWFTPDRTFNLPGLQQPITWRELQAKQWVINGEAYDINLGTVLQEARRELLFTDKHGRKSYLVIAHGDDHPGNIIVTPEPESGRVFDPVAAGWAPGAMANAKALAHTGILPMGGMYYDPRIKAQYQVDGTTIAVNYDFAETPVFAQHEAMARRVIDLRIIPVLRAMQAAGADITQEARTLKSALAMCAFFTVDTAKLLEGDNNRGLALLPATVMLSRLRGLPSLEYLQTQVEGL